MALPPEALFPVFDDRAESAEDRFVMLHYLVDSSVRLRRPPVDENGRLAYWGTRNPNCASGVFALTDEEVAFHPANYKTTLAPSASTAAGKAKKKGKAAAKEASTTCDLKKSPYATCEEDLRTEAAKRYSYRDEWDLLQDKYRSENKAKLENASSDKPRREKKAQKNRAAEAQKASGSKAGAGAASMKQVEEDATTGPSDTSNQHDEDQTSEKDELVEKEKKTCDDHQRKKTSTSGKPQTSGKECRKDEAGASTPESENPVAEKNASSSPKAAEQEKKLFGTVTVQYAPPWQQQAGVVSASAKTFVPGLGSSVVQSVVSGPSAAVLGSQLSETDWPGEQQQMSDPSVTGPVVSRFSSSAACFVPQQQQQQQQALVFNNMLACNPALQQQLVLPSANHTTESGAVLDQSASSHLSAGMSSPQEAVGEANVGQSDAQQQLIVGEAPHNSCVTTTSMNEAGGCMSTNQVQEPEPDTGDMTLVPLDEEAVPLCDFYGKAITSSDLYQLPNRKIVARCGADGVFYHINEVIMHSKKVQAQQQQQAALAGGIKNAAASTASSSNGHNQQMQQTQGSSLWAPPPGADNGASGKQAIRVKRFNAPQADHQDSGNHGGSSAWAASSSSAYKGAKGSGSSRANSSAAEDHQFYSNNGLSAKTAKGFQNGTNSNKEVRPAGEESENSSNSSGNAVHGDKNANSSNAAIKGAGIKGSSSYAGSYNHYPGVKGMQNFGTVGGFYKGGPKGGKGKGKGKGKYGGYYSYNQYSYGLYHPSASATSGNWRDGFHRLRSDSKEREQAAAAEGEELRSEKLPAELSKEDENKENDGDSAAVATSNVVNRESKGNSASKGGTVHSRVSTAGAKPAKTSRGKEDTVKEEAASTRERATSAAGRTSSTNEDCDVSPVEAKTAAAEQGDGKTGTKPTLALKTAGEQPGSSGGKEACGEAKGTSATVASAGPQYGYRSHPKGSGKGSRFFVPVSGSHNPNRAEESDNWRSRRESEDGQDLPWAAPEWTSKKRAYSKGEETITARPDRARAETWHHTFQQSGPATSYSGTTPTSCPYGSTNYGRHPVQFHSAPSHAASAYSWQFNIGAEAVPSTLYINGLDAELTRDGFAKKLTDLGYGDMYDFLFLTRNMLTGNMTAFVNFLTPAAADSFWHRIGAESSEPPYVTYAKRQGLWTNLESFLSYREHHALRSRETKEEPPVWVFCDLNAQLVRQIEVACGEKWGQKWKDDLLIRDLRGKKGNLASNKSSTTTGTVGTSSSCVKNTTSASSSKPNVVPAPTAAGAGAATSCSTVASAKTESSVPTPPPPPPRPVLLQQERQEPKLRGRNGKTGKELLSSKGATPKSNGAASQDQGGSVVQSKINSSSGVAAGPGATGTSRKRDNAAVATDDATEDRAKNSPSSSVPAAGTSSKPGALHVPFPSKAATSSAATCCPTAGGDAGSPAGSPAEEASDHDTCSRKSEADVDNNGTSVVRDSFLQITPPGSAALEASPKTNSPTANKGKKKPSWYELTEGDAATATD
ncbi:unnamed protein product [Amoebophrya sp. A120]|nr:unnamed protein product [Amoebophrya sp. A120]|eukprot:GSA120T00020258001.1